jgi:hypothetical protein
MIIEAFSVHAAAFTDVADTDFREGFPGHQLFHGPGQGIFGNNGIRHISPPVYSTGRVKEKLTPPSTLAAQQDCPWASMMAFTMERPSPLPPYLRVRALSTL